jgi:photosystem II stability/assembly factor-like uncharacterized protein
MFTGRLHAQGDIIRKGDIPFSGKTDFKFALVSQGITLWSNDGTSYHGSEPKASITLEVNNGIYEVMLGEHPMKPFFYQLLEMYPNAILRTWADTGEGFRLLSEQPLDESVAKNIEDLGNTGINAHRGISYAPDFIAKAEAAEEERENREAMNPEGLMRERFRRRANENGVIPINALLNAKKHIDQMPEPVTEDAGLWVWEWLGPANIGGRIRAIAINPNSTNTIFVGGVSGGIWRSTNGGTSWSVINDFLPSLAITCIVYDPTNTNIMYASTGEGVGNFDALPGAGIFKSTNGGTTWTQLASTDNDDFKYVNRLAHHPDSTGVLYAVTGNPNHVYKTTNGGTNWVDKLTTASKAYDIRINPGNVARLVVGCSNDLYTSNNWGSTWTDQSTGAANKLPDSPHRCEVSYCPSNSNRIYVSINTNKGEIWRSTDNGATWTQRCTGYEYLGKQGWYNNCIWVDPTNSDRVIVGGIDNWRSTDGGSTLTKISDWHDYHNGGSANSAHADNHCIISHPNYDANTNKTVYFGNDGGIQRTSDILTVSTNSGWTNLCHTSLGITQFYGVSAMPDGSVMIGGTQDNDCVRYRSSGAWSGSTGWYQAETGDGGFCAIDPTDSDIQYTEYTNLWITKSTDGGDSNFDAVSGLTNAGDEYNTLFIAPFSMDPNNHNRLIAGGSSIWRTTDGASNWASIKGTTGTGYNDNSGYWHNHACSAIDIATGNSNLIWVGYENGYVYKTTNGTAANPAWTRVDDNATAIPNRYVCDIAINPANDDEVFVTLSGYNADNVWYTDDGGTSWTQRTGTAPYDLPALPVNSVRFHNSNSNWIYIGTDLGVFSSMDKGQNWSVDKRYADNEGPCNTEVTELLWQGSDYLLAATHGRGLFRAHPLTTIYVDLNAAAGGDGSAAHPYNNVTDAVNHAGYGTNISIKANTYDEPSTILFYKKGMVRATNGSAIIK